MVNLLAHGLSAMAACAIFGSIFGLPGISGAVFIAGFIAMLIELDIDDLSQNTRSPIGHSIFFGIFWTALFSLLIWIIAIASPMSKSNAYELILALVSAYSMHIAIDSFTKEGIYSFPKGINLKRMFVRLSRGDRMCWEYWNCFQNEKLKKWIRANDDPILNAFVSIPSLLVIIVFVAIMPVPL